MLSLKGNKPMPYSLSSVRSSYTGGQTGRRAFDSTDFLCSCRAGPVTGNKQADWQEIRVNCYV